MNIIFAIPLLLSCLSNGRDMSSCEAVNNIFATTPFKVGKVTPSEMEQAFRREFEIQKVVVKNQFSNLLDTLIEYKSAKLVVVFYKGREAIFINSATIEDKDVLFAGGFNIEDMRDKIDKALNLDLDLRCDTIFVTDDEHFSNHRLIFEKNRLRKVILDFGLN